MQLARSVSAPSLLRFFHPVLAASALRKAPVQVKVDKQSYALWRDKDGRACAVEDRCPHRFAPLSAGRVRPDGRLACPFHGWHFDGKGHGVSPSQPSLQHCDVKALRVEERHGYLWLAEGEVCPSTIDAYFNVQPGFELAGCADVRMEAPIEHVLDVFSDAEHPAWVHTNLAWTEAQLSEIAYDDQREADSSRVQTSGPQRPSLAANAIGIRAGDRFHNQWVTRFDPLRAQYHVFWTSADGKTPRNFSSRATLFIVPESERSIRVIAFIHTHLKRRGLGLPYSLIKRLVVAATRYEIRTDKRFLHRVREMPLTTKGMRLGKMDGVILHNRRLLNRIYLNRAAPLTQLDSPGPTQPSHEDTRRLRRVQTTREL